VAKERLDGARVLHLVRELESAGVPQHMRVNVERELGRSARSLNDRVNRALRHRAAALQKTKRHSVLER
jgi:hypothetical protein